MRAGFLFDLTEYKTKLGEEKGRELAASVIADAMYGVRYSYTLKQAAGVLRMSYEEVKTAVYMYQLDAFCILSVARIPWWSLAEYLIDPADEVDRLFYKWIRHIPRRENGSKYVHRRPRVSTPVPERASV